MTARLLLASAVTVLASACVGTDPYTEYRNLNTGDRGNLTFYASTVTAIGDPSSVIVFRGEEGPYHCATYPTPLSLSSSTGVRCQFAGVVSPVEELIGAQCDQGGCSTVITNRTELGVTGLAAGKFSLTVTARLTDGRVVTDSTGLYFVAVDGIALTCMLAYSCPGPNGIFPGASFSWSAQPMSNGQLVAGAVSVTLDQPGVVELTVGNGQHSVRALKPGVATLRLRSGKATRLQTIRVVAFEDVVAGSVRLRASVPCQPVICIDADVNLVGDAAPQRATALAPTSVMAWTLRDGTLAVGGAGRVTATAGAEVRVAGLYEPAPADLSLMEFTVGGPGGALCHAGTIALSAKVATAQLAWTFEQLCQ